MILKDIIVEPNSSDPDGRFYCVRFAFDDLISLYTMYDMETKTLHEYHYLDLFPDNMVVMDDNVKATFTDNSGVDVTVFDEWVTSSFRWALSDIISDDNFEIMVERAIIDSLI